MSLFGQVCLCAFCENHVSSQMSPKSEWSFCAVSVVRTAAGPGNALRALLEALKLFANHCQAKVEHVEC